MVPQRLPQQFVGTSCQNQFFPRLKPFWRPKSWKKLVLTTFPPFLWFQRLPEQFVEKVETQAVLEAQIVEKVVFDNFFHHFDDSKDFLNNSWKKWKRLSKTTFSTIWASKMAWVVEKIVFDNFFHHFLWFQRLPQQFVEKVEKVGLANMFHDNFHCFWWLEASKPSEAIVPEIMETVGFTNNFQDFCYQTHGNYWFQDRKNSKNLGQYTYIYIYICIYIYIYIHIFVCLSIDFSDPRFRSQGAVGGVNGCPHLLEGRRCPNAEYRGLMHQEAWFIRGTSDWYW